MPATTEPVQPETGTRPDDARAADTENQPFPDSEHAQSGEGAAEDPSSSLNVDPPPQQPDAVDETPLSAEELADQKELLNLAHSLEQAESKTPSAPSNQSPPAAGGEPREVITLGDLASRAGQGDIYTPADKLIGSTSPLHEANAGQADTQTGIDSAPLSPDEIVTQQELLGLAHSLEQAEGTPGGPGSGPPDGTGSEGSSTPDLAEIADQPAPAASDDLQSLLGLAHALEQDEGMVPLDHAPGLTTDNNDFHAAFDPSEPLDDASWQANSLAAEQAGDEGQGAHDVTPVPGEFNSDGSDVAIFDGGFDGGADQPDNFGHY